MTDLTRHRSRLIDYPFALRPDFIAVLSLPDDLTVEEMERLVAALRALVVPK